ncbi:MAG: L-2-amino-thiazoline-4-carboxylic acid hydrolase [Nannocystaceae bacterium]|nr:L-2-amino-thiazoline-4-carboxylic acid hydrolase [Myxococcales bacterium]
MNPMRFLKPALTPSARRGLATRFNRSEIADILDDTFAAYDEQRPQLIREPSAGGRLMVHLAALTVGLYRAITARGVCEDEARALTAAVTWRIYEKMASIPSALARVSAHTAFDFLKRATDLFRRFPFSAPSYVMEDVASNDDVVAFDVRRCPVAEHFRSQGLGELCVASWCNLDVPLAQRWGAQLERSRTIAGGASHCDFRWRVIAADQQSAAGDRS